MKPDKLHGPDSALPGADKDGFIAVLDGWRGVAISLVLVYHMLLHCDFPRGGFLSHLMVALDHLGPFGVLIFFMISGFLITGRMIVEHAKLGRFALGEFYYKRAFRILPLAFLYLGLIGMAGGLHLISLRCSSPPTTWTPAPGIPGTSGRCRSRSTSISSGLP